MTAGDGVQILIVGAGVGGLALAGFLRRGGVEPAIIERVETWDGPSHGLTLPHGGGAVLEELDVAADVRAAGEPIDAWTRRDPDGTVRRRAELPVDDGAPLLAVDRRRFLDRLRGVVPDGSIRMGTTLRSIDRSGDDVVAELSDGVRERFDAVVGADGVRSRVRGLIGAGTKTFCGTTNWALRIDADVETPDEITEIWGPDGTTALVTPAADRVFVWLAARADAPGVHDGDPATIRERFDGIEWLVPALLDAADPEAIWHDDNYAVTTDTWRDGRVVLLGDAAHALHPVSRIGASLAMEDAYVLADELLNRDDALDARLADYVGRRRSRVRRLRRAARWSRTTGVAGNELLGAIRDDIALRAGLVEDLASGERRSVGDVPEAL